MKKVFMVFLICLVAFHAIAQNKYMDSLKNLLSNTTIPIARFDLLNKLGEGLFTGSSSRIDSAICQQLLQIAQESKNDSLLAISYNWLGNYFAWTSQFNNALEYFLKGVPLAKKAKDNRRLSSLYVDISAVYNRANNAADEIKYIRMAGLNLPDKNSPFFYFMDIQVKISLAKYYLLQRQSDSALHYVQASREINLVLKRTFFDAMCDVISGGVYEQLGDSAMAEVYFKKAVLIEDSNGFFYAINSPKQIYSEFLLRHNKILPAKTLAMKCLHGSVELNNNELGLAAAGYLQNIYNTLGQPDSAYYYSRLEISLRDTVFSKEKINRIQAMAFAEQLRTQEEELRNMKDEEDRKRQIQYLFIGIGIITAIILFLLLSHSVMANEEVIKFLGIIGLLAVFEFINLLIHPAIEKITNHSPVWMLIILICIASLLIPFHHRLEKWVNVKMVEKNKRIRLAAARRTIEKLEGIENRNVE